MLQEHKPPFNISFFSHPWECKQQFPDAAKEKGKLRDDANLCAREGSISVGLAQTPFWFRAEGVKTQLIGEGRVLMRLTRA